jgi:hypothetical protein
MAVGDTRIDPADLEHFAKRMDQLADDLADRKRPASQLVNSNPNHGGVIDFPCAGSFAAADTFHNTYIEKIRAMAGAFQQLEGLLRALGDASREVAKRYRTAEEYNSAKSKDIEALLGAATPPSGGQNPGGDQPGDRNPTRPRPE